ncbi:ABC transporter permease [Pokkaliibacter sp. CJK22405]|uniref:ABC transporter permease n=1 Tax=Pokkaliibacter sp. CJK22405 TaxID=3384615 RepID=UPI003984DBC6
MSQPYSPARRALLGLVGVLAFVGLWKFAQVSGWAPPGTIPDPMLLPATLMDEWQSGRLLPAIGSSLIHYVWGLALGTAFGFLVGALAASSNVIDGLHSWLARILRPIPPLAWVVFAIAWFKVSHAGAAFVIAIGVFWVNYFATYSAVRHVDPKYYELARAFGQAGFINRALHVTLPAAAPGIFSGIRTGIGQAWMTLIAAELLGVPGMGQEMNSAAGVGAYEAVVVYMLVISLVYSLSDFAFSHIEKRVLTWRPS